MSFKTIRFLLAGLLVILALVACTPALGRSGLPEYRYPLDKAQYVSSGTSIAVRYGPELRDRNPSDVEFTVRGSQSGVHQGQTILADDGKTVIFKPSERFTPGEQVTVDVGEFRLDPQAVFRPLSYSFQIAANQQPASAVSSSTPPSARPASAFPEFLTLPQDIPHYTVSTTSPEAGEGYIFVAPFYWTGFTVGSYLLILDNRGQIVYYKSVAGALNAFDFKVQPNGLLSYCSEKDSAFYLMDSHYQVVDSYTAGNGYGTDLHDLQILPNGNALLMIYDSETVDMSKVVTGGQTNATFSVYLRASATSRSRLWTRTATSWRARESSPSTRRSVPPCHDTR